MKPLCRSKLGANVLNLGKLVIHHLHQQLGVAAALLFLHAALLPQNLLEKNGGKNKGTGQQNGGIREKKLAEKGLLKILCHTVLPSVSSLFREGPQKSTPFAH